MLLLVTLALSADYEREVRTGITSFKRFTDGDRPQDIYAVRADLSSPNVGLHASKDDRGVEWHTDTLSFAEQVGAIAAINGDWSCTTCSGEDYLHPLGLAISGGMLWNDHIETDAIGSTWGYLACTIDKHCDLDQAAPLSDASMVFSPLHLPTIYPLRYQEAIGANGLVLVEDGVAGSGCYDTSTTNPRSAACVEADGTHLWLVVIDGRGSGGSTGMSCDEVRDLLLGDPFNCWDAVMLDGGGSSTLVVEDTNSDADCNPRGDNDLCVKNNPSDGSLRTVANHLAITWEDTADSRCATANGKWCNGTVIAQCQGGRFTGTGDCAVYGATCQEDGDFAFCVDYRCPGGDGLRHYNCLDGTVIEGCNDGVYGTGDCAAFGLVCGEDAAGASCMDSRCAAGPHSSFCLDDSVVAACTDGTYAESTCAEGTACVEGACVTPGGDDSGGGDTGEGHAAAAPGEATILDRIECAPGCSATGPAATLPLLGALAALRRRRARSSSRPSPRAPPSPPGWSARGSWPPASHAPGSASPPRPVILLAFYQWP